MAPREGANRINDAVNAVVPSLPTRYMLSPREPHQWMAHA